MDYIGIRALAERSCRLEGDIGKGDKHYSQGGLDLDFQGPLKIRLELDLKPHISITSPLGPAENIVNLKKTTKGFSNLSLVLPEHGVDNCFSL